MYRPEHDECIQCKSEFDATSRSKTQQTWMFLPTRAYSVKTTSIICGGCGKENFYDGLADHLFHTASGTLWHHALLNMKTNSILDSGVTGCAFIKLCHKMYVDMGSPANFPTQSTPMRVWLSYIELQVGWWKNCFIDPFCDRAVGTKVPLRDRKPNQKVRCPLTLPC